MPKNGHFGPKLQLVFLELAKKLLNQNTIIIQAGPKIFLYDSIAESTCLTATKIQNSHDKKTNGGVIKR